MNLSQRSKYSLCQFLDVLNGADVAILLEKHQVVPDDTFLQYGASLMRVRDAIMSAKVDAVSGLLQEVARTQKTFRAETNPRYKFDERWDDLTKCLELDGFVLDGEEKPQFVSFDPELVVPGAVAVEDELTRQIRVSELTAADDIIKLLEASAGAYRANRMNDCLTTSRIALETLARTIALRVVGEKPESAQITSWGRALAGLHSVGFLEKADESALATAYTQISRGAHVPIGFTEQDWVRLSRQLALWYCYFLIKQYNGSIR